MASSIISAFHDLSLVYIHCHILGFRVHSADIYFDYANLKEQYIEPTIFTKYEENINLTSIWEHAIKYQIYTYKKHQGNKTKIKCEKLS